MVAMKDLKSFPDRGAGSSPAPGTKFEMRKWWNGIHVGLRSRCRKD